MSLYAATKKANELMAHTYSHLYGLPTTGLRFFTVYGPWGRPDMAPCCSRKRSSLASRSRCSTRAACAATSRSSTTSSKERCGCWRARPAQCTASGAPYAVFNIGNHDAVELTEFIATLERLLGREAHKDLLPMQPGDVEATYASIDRLAAATGFAPAHAARDGARALRRVVPRLLRRVTRRACGRPPGGPGRVRARW